MIITDTTYRDVLRDKLRGSFRTVFRLEQMMCEWPIVYPHPITTTILGYGESSAWAKAVIRERVEDVRDEPDFRILRFELKEIQLNKEDGLIATRIFDTEGRPIALESSYPIPFRGLAPDDCPFQLGEIVQVALTDSLELGIVDQLPMTPEEVAFHNPRMIHSPLLEIRPVDDQRTLRDTLTKLPVCDQTDATYGILHGPGDGEPEHYPAYRLARPLGEVTSAEQARLEDRRRYEHGFVVVYATEGLPPKDYFRLGLNDCWSAELKEPHVLVYDFDAHVAVAIDDLRLLKGTIDDESDGSTALPRHKVDAARRLIAANRSQMLADFRAMAWLKQHGRRKDYELVDGSRFVLEREVTMNFMRWP